MIIDTNNNMTNRIKALKAANVTTVIRYVASGLVGYEKVVKAPEARALAAAKIKLGLVYEISGHPNGSAVGKRDGEFARSYAPLVGAPKDAIIWSAVDYDAGPGDLAGIVAYHVAFKKALEGYYRAGAYASGYICDELFGRELIVARWLTMSQGFRGTKASLAAGRWELLQRLERNLTGLSNSIDPDVVHIEPNGEPADIGDFIPTLEPPENIEGSVAWIQDNLNKLTGTQLDVDNIMGAFTIRAIENFQAAHPPLVVDGVVGPKTRAVMLELLSKAVEPGEA
jgi:hypothetical protein